MKKLVLILVISSITFSNTNAQLILNTGLTPQQLANIITGPGITVSNVTFTGTPYMAGSFSATGTNLGITSGAILATGYANTVIGPNGVPDAGDDMNLPGDTLLDALADTTTYDACILEFDFNPQSSLVTFRYIFGSEEYPEYVCSPYNDVFAFLISGPGITGSQNMALIPGTSIPVAINTVNGGVIGSYGSPGPLCGLGYSNLYIDNSTGTTIELDGFTIPMIAQAIVQPCQTYHLRIMIADAGDGVYDSGVFIEQGSLFSTPVVDAGIDQTFCSGTSTVLGANPAPGYTYLWSPAAGLNSPTVSNPSVSLVNPGTYTYVIVGNSGTCLFSDTVHVTVTPAPSVSFTVNPAQACAGQILDVNYTGSTASNYSWNFGSATILSGSGPGPYQISFPVATQDSISVFASELGCSGSFALAVSILANPIAAFTFPPTACPGETIAINFTGSASPLALYSWNFGSGQINSGNGGGPYSVSWASPGLASVSLYISDQGCVSTTQISQINIVPPPLAFAGNDITLCTNNFVSLGGVSQPGYTYLWTPVINLDNPLISNPGGVFINSGTTPLSATYNVMVTSPQGCTASDDVTVTVTPSTIHVDFTSPTAQCLEGNSFDFSVQGVYPAGSDFWWDFSSTATPSSSSLADQHAVIFNAVGTFTITLYATSEGCVMQPVSHGVEVNPMPDVDFSTSDLHGCSPLSVQMANHSDDLTNTFLWTLSNGVSFTTTAPSFTLETPGLYDVSLTATTSHGCSATITKEKYLTVYDEPIADFIARPSKATIENPLISMQNNSLNADTYEWDFGDGTSGDLVNPSHLYGNSGQFVITLIAINTNDCTDTASGKIEINEGLSFYIPSSFSPNNDGLNDFFQGYGINIKNYQMTIFDRWGNQIYETQDYFKPWDGKVKSVVQNDVYICKFLVTDVMDELHSYISSVTLIK